MTTVAMQLTDSLQGLVDARLDTIDRMLLGRVSRADRMAIVREVEAQIFDQLQERDADRLDRDDVLAVLGRLDPPEAYLSGDYEDVSIPPAFSGGPRLGRLSGPGTPKRVGNAGGILGLCTLVFLLVELPLSYAIAVTSDSEHDYFRRAYWSPPPEPWREHHRDCAGGPGPTGERLGDPRPGHRDRGHPAGDPGFCCGLPALVIGPTEGRPGPRPETTFGTRAESLLGLDLS